MWPRHRSCSSAAGWRVVSGGMRRVSRVARVRSVRLRVTGVNDSIEKGLIGPAGVRRRAGKRRAGRHNARERGLLRPKRMEAAAGATKTHGSADGFRRFLAFGRIIWPKRKKAAGSAGADVRFGDLGGAFVRFGDPLGAHVRLGERGSSALGAFATYAWRWPRFGQAFSRALGTTPSPPLLRCAVPLSRRQRTADGANFRSIASRSADQDVSSIWFTDQPIGERREDRRRGQWPKRKSVDLAFAAPRA